MMDDLSVLHEIATDRLARIRVITSEWQKAEFSFSVTHGSHQALTRIIDVLNDNGRGQVMDRFLARRWREETTDEAQAAHDDLIEEESE